MNNTKINHQALDLVQWPVRNVQAFGTTRLSPFVTQHSLFTNDFNFFNLSDHANDNPSKVLAHRHQLQNLFSRDKKIQWLKQVHSDQVVTIENYSSKPLIADAVITRQKNIALSIMTADCLPNLSIKFEVRQK